MAARLLKNKRSGVILPWNQYLETHPDMEPYEAPAPAAAKPAPKAKAKPRAKKTAIPAPPPDTEIADLLEGLDST